MSEIIRQGLLITAIGMGLVFAVIIFLWGLMALMMRLTSGEKKEKENPGQLTENELVHEVVDDGHLEGQIQEIEQKRKAAAAAVAVTLAIEADLTSQKNRKSEEKQGLMSPWQTVHRIRQLGNRK